MILDKLTLLFMLLFNFGLCEETQINYNKVLIGQSILYGISYLTKEYQNSSTCYRQLSQLFDDFEARRVWALKTLDVSGRPGSGFIYGNNHWLGSHDECIEVSNKKKYEISYSKVKHANATPYDFPPYELGFYVAHFEHNSSLQFHSQMPLEFLIQVGLCMPNSCTTEELGHLLNEYFNKKFLLTQQLYNLDLKLIRIRHLHDSPMWMLSDPKSIALIVISSVIILFAIIGTCYDVRKHNLQKNLFLAAQQSVSIPNGKQISGNVSEVDLVSNSSSETDSRSTIGEILKCFSIYTNTKKLVDTNLPESSVKIIHGLKFFSMAWVIAVHAIFFQNDYTINLPIGFRISESIYSQPYSNSTYCVDSFLCISGFLLTYLFLKSGSKSTQVNYLHKVSQFFMMFINRFLRLTPTYLYTILFTAVMYGYYLKNSAMFTSENNEELCSKYWWRNLLYINNLYPRSEMCMSWSWYLSVDTQCFTIVTFLLILSTVAMKTSATLVILLILANVVSVTYKSYSIGYIPTLDEQFSQLDAIYDFPWQRIGAYLSGVITAYILVVKLEGKLQLTKQAKIILWTGFPIVNLGILFTIYTRNISVEFSAFYMGISRTLWGIGIGWILIACCTGNARALEKFLSFRGFIPFSRLTYCAYLLNPLLANMIFMGAETSRSGSLASFTLSSLGLAFSTYSLSYLFVILVESPSILLSKMLFERINKKKKTKETAGGEA